MSEAASRQPVVDPNRADPANQSLAGALRASFWLLTLIILGMAVAYVLSGIRSIDSGTVGIQKVFGRQVGVVQPGLAFTWPLPVGEIEIVSTRPRTLRVTNFFVHMTPEQYTLKPQDLPVRGEGLRPGMDGALLTGDRSLPHLKIECTYTVDSAVDFVSNIASRDPGKTEQNAEEIVRTIVCAAAVRAAGQRTIDGLMRGELAGFRSDVMLSANRQLRRIGAGLQITELSAKDPTWPLAALPAFKAAQQAKTERKSKIDAAQADAIKAYRLAAGEEFYELVGHPGGPPEGFQPTPNRPYNLIGRYNIARAVGQEEQAAALQEQIEEILADRSRIGGEALSIIVEAESKRNAVEQAAKSFARQFESLEREYKQNPRLALHLRWAELLKELLGNEEVEKVVVSTSPNYPTVLRIRQDPEIAKELERLQLRKKQEQRTGGPPAGP